jgi:hypothetical protein
MESSEIEGVFRGGENKSKASEKYIHKSVHLEGIPFRDNQEAMSIEKSASTEKPFSQAIILILFSYFLSLIVVTSPFSTHSMFPRSI